MITENERGNSELHDGMSGSTSVGQVIQVGAITLDSGRQLVEINSEEVKLTSTEFKLLQTLTRRLGVVQSRSVLQRDAWGYNFTLKTRTVDTHVTRLRNKMGEAGGMIKTVRGFGYLLDEP